MRHVLQDQAGECSLCYAEIEADTTAWIPKDTRELLCERCVEREILAEHNAAKLLLKDAS